MGRAGRRKPGEPTVFREYLETTRNPALQIIAREADRLRLSIRQVAGRMNRDEASLRRTFDAAEPHRSTIDSLADAVGLSPLRLHAALDDLTAEECDAAFYRFVNGLGDSDGIRFNEQPEVVRKKLAEAYRSAPPEARNAAARCVLLPSLTVQVGLLDVSLALDRPSLVGLTRYATPEEEALDRIARALESFGFDDAEVNALKAPIVEAVRRRTSKHQEAIMRRAAFAPYRHLRPRGTK